MFIQLYAPLYTSIIKTRFAEFNYIDLFAGSGLNKFEDSNIILAGSPIIALSFATKPFSKAFFIDLSQGKITLLKNRISRLKELSKKMEYREFIFSNIENTITIYFSQDANTKVKKIYEEIEKRHEELLDKIHRGCHNLVFIDPYGFEFKRRSLERILSSSVRNDLIIFFNSYGAGMQAYNVIHHNYSSRLLNDHLGSEWYNFIKQTAKRSNINEDKLSRNTLSHMLSSYYVGILKKHDYVVEVIRLPLKLEMQQFDLIFACKRTRRGNPFLKGVRYIKNLLESTNYRLVDLLKEYVETGKLPGLLNYVIKDPEKALRRYGTARRYGIDRYLNQKSS